MTDVVRYAGFALLLLFAIALAVVCGELMCDSGTHACCGRVSRAERARRLASRLLVRVSDRIRGAVTGVRGAYRVGARDSASPLSVPLGLAPLRI